MLITAKRHLSMTASASGCPKLSSGSLDEVLETPALENLLFVQERQVVFGEPVWAGNRSIELSPGFIFC